MKVKLMKHEFKLRLIDLDANSVVPLKMFDSTWLMRMAYHYRFLLPASMVQKKSTDKL